MEGLNESDRLLSLEDAGALLGVTKHAMRKWISEGKVESHKLGGRVRVSVREVIRLMNASRRPIPVKELEKELEEIEVSHVAA